MARWKLLQPHYIVVPDTHWEYKETDQSTGRQGRKLFNVPRYLNPNDPSDFTHPELGAIIVTNGNNPDPRDLKFEGPPTPEMEPIDAEAKKITDAESPKWVHPIESLPGGYNASLLSNLESQVAALAAGQKAAPVAIKGVDPEDFKKMQEQLAALMAKNTELEAQIAGRPSRRI